VELEVDTDEFISISVTPVSAVALTPTSRFDIFLTTSIGLPWSRLKRSGTFRMACNLARKPASPPPLAGVLQSHGLTYEDVRRAMDNTYTVSVKVIAEIAKGTRRGNNNSRRRILNAVNTKTNSTYPWEDLFGEPDPQVGTPAGSQLCAQYRKALVKTSSSAVGASISGRPT